MPIDAAKIGNLYQMANVLTNIQHYYPVFLLKKKKEAVLFRTTSPY